MSDTIIHPRRVKSFVKRDGRMTEAQRQALNTIWHQFGYTKDSPPQPLADLFGRDAPCFLEVGFGSGASLLQVAKDHPEYNFIGIETYQPGIGTLLLGIEGEQIKNIRLFYADAVEILETHIPDASLAGFQLFFPDPWPKRKHHKRRLVQPEFIEFIARKIQMNGMLHMATDWEHYAMQMMQVLSNSDKLRNEAGVDQFAGRSLHRPIVTKFENRGTDAGRLTWELQFTRIA